MVKLLQWGFGGMSTCNGVIFWPKSTPFPPISGCINWVGWRLSPSIYASYYPFPTSSPSYPPSSPIFHIMLVLAIHLSLFLSLFRVICVLLVHTSLFLFLSILHIIFLLLMHLSLFLWFFHIIFVLLVDLSFFLFLSIFHTPLVYTKVLLVVTHIRTWSK